ncbi:MAG: SRPBCC family protein [Mycobacterium sp.]|nr:SRPBCC family protein [Mycobacterium sp.]
MTRTLAVEQSRVIPVGVDEAFSRTLPIPLTTILSRWYGPVPPLGAVREQVGDWDTPGQTRLLLFKVGGGMREELTKVDPPHAFGYTLSGFTGPLGPLIGHADGDWTFTPSDSATSGTVVTWRWNIHARSALAAWLLPVLGFLWKGYARKSLETLSAVLTA